MRKAMLRQTSFHSLRRGCLCLSSRSVASDSNKLKHYDLLVIGGGSGGLACSKEAADIGKKAALLDFVSPSPQGTQWGLGGTCVNVGCIPKKLMHQASLLGGAMVDAGKFGWNTPEKLQHDWNTMCEGVQGHVRALNWGFRVQLKTKDVDYYNAKGRLLDRNTVIATDRAGKETILTADNIVIATGMRPKYPTEIPGALEHAISSDDIFWQLKPPGKTLVVGASYVALECAGFLAGLGYDTSVMVRSIPLRGFDQQMAQLVAEGLEDHGTRLIHESVPTKIEKQGEQLMVEWTGKGDQSSQTESFDTVLMAIGRVPETSQLGLQDVGVELDKAGFVVGGHDTDHERTSVGNIYAVGDVLKDRPELTPVAIRAGRLLARRLFDGATEQMDYDKVPTTVFTPVEYSSVGLSEEAALEKYGEDNIEVYHGFYTPLEYTIPGRSTKQCYMKLITERAAPQKVYGVHYMGPSAGEVMQGFAVALRCGMTREMLLSTVGIHPTSAETFVSLHITKRSGLDPTITGC